MDEESSREPSPDSELSLESGNSSTCDISEHHRPCSPHFIFPASAEEFENLVLQKRQLVMQKSQMEPTVVFLKHVPLGYGKSQLVKIFSQFGRILHCKLKTLRKTGRKGKISFIQVAYIQFSRTEEAELAVQNTCEGSVYDKLFNCVILSANQVPPGIFTISSTSSAIAINIPLKSKAISVSPLRPNFHTISVDSRDTPESSSTSRKRRSTLTGKSPVKKLRE